MGTLTIGIRRVEYQWATDVAFDGIRMEVLSEEGNVIFDVSVPDVGAVTVNTFGKEVDIDLLLIAVEVAKRPR